MTDRACIYCDGKPHDKRAPHFERLAGHDLPVIVRDHNGNTLGRVLVDVDPARIVAVEARTFDNGEGLTVTVSLAEGGEEE